MWNVAPNRLGVVDDDDAEDKRLISDVTGDIAEASRLCRSVWKFSRL